MTEYDQAFEILAKATHRNASSVRCRLIRSQLKSNYEMTDKQVDLKLAALGVDSNLLPTLWNTGVSADELQEIKEDFFGFGNELPPLQ
jgi:lipopolysaccharide biosynthesis regulator YciM